MKTNQELKNTLHQIDHKGYPAYKQLKGSYRFPNFILNIDHVQGDPFAAPSKISIQVEGKRAGFPPELYDTKEKKIALQDYLLRGFAGKIRDFSFRAKGSGKSGLMSVSNPGQEILERTGCQIDSRSGDVILRMEIGFPANGRTINSRELEKILFTFLPQCVEKTLFYQVLDAVKLKETAELAEDQTYIRSELEKQGLVAFVANGAILPRESGVSKRPMKRAVAFRSPKEMEIEMNLPNHGTIKGMGIRKGVTLIVGGGYHGKSTLLKALELGVYNHRAGDGREYVISEESGMKIRAEDGRSVKKVDISMFINNLPNGKDTKHFQTEDASGSTSQAANVIEAMEAGSRVLFIDEDTSATNFMVRDELMQRVIHRDMEPITPFIERVRALYEEFGISTVIVAGSSGAYFQVADSIVQMDRYVPKEITEAAKTAAKDYPQLTLPKEGPKKPNFDRKIRSYPGLKSKGRIKIKTMGRDGVTLNHENIDLRYVEQLMDSEQLTSLGNVVKHLEENVFDGKRTLLQTIEELYKKLDLQGLSAVCDGSYLPGNLAMPRKQEIYACLNRYRRLGTFRK